MKCIEDEIPFELPEGWRWSRLISLSSIITDGEHKTPRRVKEFQGYYLLSARNIQNGFLSLTDVDFVDKSEFENISRRCNPKDNDVLISCSGSIGRVTVVNDGNDYVMVRSAAMVRPISINPYYLMFALQSGQLQNQIQKVSKQTAQANLFLGAIQMLLVPLPPEDECYRIVLTIDNFLKIVDFISSEQDRLSELVSTTKAKILDLAIRGKLVPQNPDDEPASILLEHIRTEKEKLIKQGKIKRDKKESIIFKGEDNSYYETINGKTKCINNEIPYDLPVGWGWTRLGSYTQKVTDQVASGSFASLRENVPSLKEPNYAIMVKTADFSNGFSTGLTYTTKDGYEFLENSNLFGGELIMSNIGSIGKIFIVPELDYKMTLAPNSIMIKFIDDEHRDYAYNFLKSPLGYIELISITSGTALLKFNKSDLKTILIPIPPLREQKKIVKYIDASNEILEKIIEFIK